MNRHLAAAGRRAVRHRQLSHKLAEMHLQRAGFGREALALAAEQLLLESLDLVLEFVDLRGLTLQEPGNLPGLE